MTAQAIGEVAGKIVDRWTWYQTALQHPEWVGTDKLPIHEDEPQQGYFRVRRKGAPWEPVAIFYPESSEQIVAYRDGKEVRDVNSLWVWCCRQPIEYEAYEKAMAGNGWDDEPPAAPGIGDNSGEADPFDALRIEFLGEKEQAEEFMKQPIKTQAQADKVAIWAKRLTAIKTKAEGLHKVEKQPHLDAGRAVDDKWRDLKTEPDDLAKKLKLHAKPFLDTLKRAEEERQRKAQEEAARIRREAQEAARQAEEVEDTAARERAKEDAARALQSARDAEKEAEARKVSAGRTGARIGFRVEKIGVVTDYAKAAAALVAMKHKDFFAEIDRLAQRAAKSGMAFDGMEIREEEKIV